MFAKRMFIYLFVIVLGIFMVVPSLCASEYKADFNQWKALIGNWKVVDGAYENSDTSNSNTNAYIELEQKGTEFVYEWTMTIDATTNFTWGPGGGIHILCSDYKNETGRGNSYLIFQDGTHIRFYKGSEVIQFPTPAKVGDTFPYRVEYNSNTGVLKVYKEGKFIGEWKDSFPLESGMYLSLRTNCTAVTYRDLKVTIK